MSVAEPTRTVEVEDVAPQFQPFEQSEEQPAKVGGIPVKLLVQVGIAVLAIVVLWSALGGQCKGTQTSALGKVACGVGNSISFVGKHMGLIVALVALSLAGPALGGLGALVKGIRGTSGGGSGDDNGDNDGGDDGDDDGGDAGEIIDE